MLKIPACGNTQRNSEPLLSRWDNGVRKFSIDNLKSVDCGLLGRNTSEGFIPYWGEVANNPKNSEYKLGKLFTDIPKVVFSKKLKTSKWENTTMVKGNIVEQIKKLKKKKGKDIIVYGGVSFDSSLIKEGLIDEYHLLVNPLAMVNGMKIFTVPIDLELEKSIQFNCGVNI